MEKLEISAVEINAVMHCNLTCAGCSHGSPLARPSNTDPDVVFNDLSNLKTVAAIDEIRVVGGEPLLHPRLSDLLRAIRATGAGRRVRLITNGTRLRHAGWQWVSYVDEVSVSVYPDAVVPQDAIDELQRRGASAGAQVTINPFNFFRPVIARELLSAEETAAVFETCQVAHAWSCHPVHEGYVYLCPMTVPMPGTAPGDVSRCSIEPVATLADRLAGFLRRTVPLPECSSCLGTVGQLIPHRLANRKTWEATTKSTIDWLQIDKVRGNPWADNGCAAVPCSHSGEAPSEMPADLAVGHAR